MNKKNTPEQILQEAIERYEFSHIFGLFSGGHDSLTVTHWASRNADLSAVVHIDTGIGLPETRQFVDSVAEQYGWNLLVYAAHDYKRADGSPDPQIYEELVTEYGFPGPKHHTKMYNRLKERPLSQLCRDHKVSGKRIGFISGIRAAESSRRARIKSGEIQRQGNRVWIAPFFNLSNDEMEAYREANNLPKSPVKAKLCMSGECLCGAFAKKDELKEIDFWYPEMGSRLRNLEKQVAQAGFPWGWDESPPPWWSRHQAAIKSGQEDMFTEDAENEIQMLCTTCQFKHDHKDEGEPIITSVGGK